MSREFTSPDAQHRTSVDGRVAFGLSTLGLAALLLFLLDRVGAPSRLVASLGPLTALCGMAALGLLLRGMRVSSFYAAGRSAPPPWAGLALAALLLGLFAPLLPPRPGAWSQRDLIAGFLAGAVAMALATGPLLRRTGAYSLVDLLTARFPSAILRIGLAATVGLACLCVSGAGFETATRGLQTALGVDRGNAVALASATLIFIVLPGGLTGIVWCSVAAGSLFVLGAVLPLALSVGFGDGGPPVFLNPDAWSAASQRLAEWSGAPAGPASSSLHIGVALTCALGVGALAPMMAPAIATFDRKSAFAAGRSGVFWCCILAALTATTLVASVATLESVAVDQRADQLTDQIYEASARGLVMLCGNSAASPAEAAAACGAADGAPGALRPADIRARGSFLMTALPGLRGQGDAFAGLDAAGSICLALALAAAGFQAAATTFSRDLLRGARRGKALASRRLATTRLAALAAILATGWAATARSFDPAALISLAIMISASGVAPLLALTFWPRAGALDASAALVCGCLVDVAAGGSHIGSAPIERLATASLIAAAAALAAGVGLSLCRRPDPLGAGSAFFERLSHGYGDMLNSDGGA